MILTERFVFIHLRKTGGTFVSTILGRLYRRRGWLARVRNRIRGKTFRSVNQHGTCAEIPESHRHLPVVASIRNPFDRYVSMWRFKGWQRNPGQWFADPEAIRRRYPRSPDLTFAEFVDVASSTFKGLDDASVPEGERLGAQSEELVRYFWRDPAGTFPRIDDAYLRERRWERDAFPVRWLRMESLNRDLRDLLLGFGHSPDEVDFILSEGRILPEQSRKDPRPPGEDWRALYTPELLETVRRRERLFLSLFPEYDA
jgi:hypothetical protein